jgi:hypothetical protein
MHDGLDWDGLVIYASKTTALADHSDRFIEGWIEANQGFRSNPLMKQLLVFGDSGVDLYVYEPAKRQYSARDRVSLDLNESFASFEEMLAAALKTRLADE